MSATANSVPSVMIEIKKRLPHLRQEDIPENLVFEGQDYPYQTGELINGNWTIKQIPSTIYGWFASKSGREYYLLGDIFIFQRYTNSFPIMGGNVNHHSGSFSEQYDELEDYPDHPMYGKMTRLRNLLSKIPTNLV